MAKTLISLGANLGNSRQVMQLAGEMILNRFGASNVVFSRLYRTPAVGGPAGQDDFYNAVVTVESADTSFGVWRVLCDIEQALGRQRRHRWESRRIDLDVLLHNEERHWTPTLKIPHPRMVTRTFVLEPACEIASQWIEPVTGRTIESLNNSLRKVMTVGPSSDTKAHILVVAESPDRIARIAEEIDVSFEKAIAFQSLDFLTRMTVASQFEKVRHQFEQKMEGYLATLPLQLLVFAGASPDPAVVHWEDYCRGWGELLGLVPSKYGLSGTTAFRRLPKYLLAANDPVWAAHELHAAIHAMTCSIQPDGDFFDV